MRDWPTSSSPPNPMVVRAPVGFPENAPEPDFVVLTDPDGNVFCVVDLSRAPSGG